MASTLVHESLFIRRSPSPRARRRLFCFPYAGAGASIYGEWSNFLPAEIEIIAIQLPGREDRTFEQPFSRLDPLVRTVAQAIRPYLHVPFAFFGYCCGAVACYELTRELGRRFGVNPVHFFAASQPAPHLPYKDPSVQSLSDEEFKQTLREIDGTADEILQNEDMLQLLLPALLADFLLRERYCFQHDAPLNCPLTLLGGVEDPRVCEDDLKAWREHTQDSFSLHFFEGGHFFVNDLLQDVVNVLVTALL